MKELRKAKIEPTPRTALREARKETKEDRKKKRRRDFSKVHVTNVHLWVRERVAGLHRALMLVIATGGARACEGLVCLLPRL